MLKGRFLGLLSRVSDLEVCLFLIYFSLNDNCFTILCSFLSCISMNQP